MALFGGQYYLELRRLAHRAILDAGQRLTRPALFERMWTEHSKKSVIATLDENARKEEEKKIRSVIEGLEFRLPYIKPSSTLVEFRRLYRQAEAVPEVGYLTEQFAQLLAKLKVLLSQPNHGIPRGEVLGADSLFERLRAKGYDFICEPRPRIQRRKMGFHEVSSDGLPRNYVTSHFESSRRKH